MVGGAKMSREIKFRAWLKFEERMEEVAVINFADQEICLYENGVQGEWRYFADSILMQYTGLKDKCGKEIYEGDIVRVLNNYYKEYECGEVAMGGLGLWAIKLQELKVPVFEFVDDRLSLIHSTERIEVIGNIYEHRHLLEVE